MKRTLAALVVLCASCATARDQKGPASGEDAQPRAWRVVTRPASQVEIDLDFHPSAELRLIVMEQVGTSPAPSETSATEANLSVGFDFPVSDVMPGEVIEGEIYLSGADPRKRYEIRLRPPDELRVLGPTRFVLSPGQRLPIRVVSSAQRLSRVRAEVVELGGDVNSEKSR